MKPGRVGDGSVRRALLVVGALLVGASLPAPSEAQSGAESGARTLAQRVAAVEEGRGVFRYATRPDVWICQGGIRIGERSWGRWDGGPGWDPGWDAGCRKGPAEVELQVRDGRVLDVELLDGEGADGRARELGTVEPGEAVAFLASLARGEAGSRSDQAVFPMVIADLAGVWLELEGIARDPEAPTDARKDALFWLGQEAAEAAVAGLTEVATDGEEQEVREAAVFALSQRPGTESVPALMELARTAPHAGTRESALFWLAQSNTPEVVDFFAEILRGGGGG